MERTNLFPGSGPTAAPTLWTPQAAFGLRTPQLPLATPQLAAFCTPQFPFLTPGAASGLPTPRENPFFVLSTKRQAQLQHSEDFQAIPAEAFSPLEPLLDEAALKQSTSGVRVHCEDLAPASEDPLVQKARELCSFLA